MPTVLSSLYFICYKLPCFVFHWLGGLEVIVKKDASEVSSYTYLFQNKIVVKPCQILFITFPAVAD